MFEFFGKPSLARLDFTGNIDLVRFDKYIKRYVVLPLLGGGRGWVFPCSCRDRFQTCLYDLIFGHASIVPKMLYIVWQGMEIFLDREKKNYTAEAQRKKRKEMIF